MIKAEDFKQANSIRKARLRHTLIVVVAVLFTLSMNFFWTDFGYPIVIYIFFGYSLFQI